MSHQKILILDFGSQVAQLIARRVREQRAMYMPTIKPNSALFVKHYYYIYMPTCFADFLIYCN
ncbi:MAG: hypothetical protein J5X23_09250 [Candidatus Accumulibacter sp.]|uniref:hypothetical protein n=1 Tax=Accumulibacter sp. TaxID=2053492 RepID=UPI001B163DBE|nr:hypothetical protein [Accumulibacter sp.]MBO3715140.1 hypothetical protein [Accumulibacter sp.]